MTEALLLIDVPDALRLAGQTTSVSIGNLLNGARRHKLPVFYVGETPTGSLAPRANEPSFDLGALDHFIKAFGVSRLVAAGSPTTDTRWDIVVDASVGQIGNQPDTQHVLRGWNPNQEQREVGVGPHPKPWPQDGRLDEALLREGDRRNVLDQYRYWRHEAIVAELDARRHNFHVAIENWQHDFNIGTMVRNANAFLAEEIHIIGKKKWNRRGAMVTDKYQHIRHHPTFEAFTKWTTGEDLEVIGIDILPQSRPIEGFSLPERCVLLFGQEGPGLSTDAQAACATVLSIAQFGSTRSVNAGVASGIAMHAWIQQHAQEPS